MGYAAAHPLPVVLAAALLLLVGCAAAPKEYHEPVPLTADGRSAQNSRVFDRVWELVHEKYYDVGLHGADWSALRVKYRPEVVAATDDETLYAAINRMVGELKDRHVFAYTPRHSHEGLNGYKVGLGFRLTKIDEPSVVAGVMPGSPAEAVGIRPGCVLVAFNGHPLPDGKWLDAYIARSDQSVALDFLDEHGDKRSVTLVPKLLPLDSTRVLSRAEAGGIYYLRFDSFSHDSISWLSRELKAHPSAPGVIIDLRENNGGGSTALQLAVREFFAQGRVLGHVIGRAGKIRDLDTLSVFPARYGGKIAILAGEATASSAEIFAHVMQFYKRATVVGRRTAGSVVEGYFHTLPDGGYLEVAERDYIGLDDQRLEGRGITPDMPVTPPTLADLRAGKDRDLETALQILRQP